jgi:uncharacterized protein YaaN involved in tellurite resistance
MKGNFDELDDVFNTSSEIVESSIVSKETTSIEDNSEEKNESEDTRKDYEYTRGNLYSIIEKGQEALDGVLELAQESDSARAYEVAGQLIKSVGDATDKLLDLQKKLKDLEEDNTKKGPTNVTNALFVGSTAELSKLLKQNKEEE